MAVEKIPQAAFLPGEDPEAVAANAAYQDALKRLTASLDQRKNRFFDPVLLAAAKGFLDPGSSNFFDSLGRVAGNVSEAQERKIKEDQDIAAQKLSLAGQGIELQRLKARDAELARYLGGGEPAGGALPGRPAAPGATPAGALPVAQGAPSGAPEGAPAGALSRASGETQAASDVLGIQIAPPDKSLLTGRQYIALNRFDKSKSQADLLREANKIDQDNIVVREGGAFNRATGMWHPAPTGKTEEIQIYGSTYKVDASTAALLAHLARNDDPRYHDLAQRVLSGPRRATPDAAGKPSAGLVSEAERERQRTRREAREKALADIEVTALKDFDQRKRDADDSISTANVFRRFSEDPNATKMFGILSNDKLSSAIATLVRDGVGIPGFTVGTKAIEDIMRNAGLNAADQAKYRTFLMYATQMQLQQSKYMKGAVSDFEQRLMAQAGITAQDTSDAIRMKADILTRRAQFDKRVAKAFKESSMNADEFLDSEQYQEIRKKYDKDLADLAAGMTRLASAAPAGQTPRARPPAAPAQGAGSARQNLDRLLQQGRQ